MIRLKHHKPFEFPLVEELRLYASYAIQNRFRSDRQSHRSSQKGRPRFCADLVGVAEINRSFITATEAGNENTTKESNRYYFLLEYIRGEIKKDILTRTAMTAWSKLQNESEGSHDRTKHSISFEVLILGKNHMTKLSAILPLVAEASDWRFGRHEAFSSLTFSAKIKTRTGNYDMPLKCDHNRC
jgi:hypothetical protein